MTHAKLYISASLNYRTGQRLKRPLGRGVVFVATLRLRQFWFSLDKVLQLQWSVNEAQTRRVLIDKSLARASWDVGNQEQVGIEIPVDGFDPAAWKILQKTLQRQGAKADTKLPSGISDYVLYRSNGEILAVVEAKRASFDPRNAQAQLTFYLNEIEKRQGFRPFGFTSNGYRMYFYEPGAVKREVFGFFSKGDLERLLALAQSRKPFLEQTPAPQIAGRPLPD